MNCRQVRQDKSEAQSQCVRSQKGFTLVEIMFVLLIAGITVVMAVPLVSNVTSYFRLRGAVSSVTGAIQAARYQAIFQGCPYQVVFAATPNTYQIRKSCPSNGTFVNDCPGSLTSCPVPLSGTGTPITLNADITLNFSPGGKITSTTSPMAMTITYSTKPPETITVSSYGSINVNP
jgi:prepilin-type N-terminal cleavage/methylation domain-containing protein